METLSVTDIKKNRHRDFWNGKLKGLILIPPSDVPLYETDHYRQQFEDTQTMWDVELRRTEGVNHWPTDGLATVRPNLGTIFIPAIAGQTYTVGDGHMPWPGKPLTLQQIREARKIDVEQSEMFRRAAAFYRIYLQNKPDGVFAYHPDTQGIFDLVHLLYGDELFYELADPEQSAQIHELMNICLDLFCNVTRQVKTLLNEPMGEMVHGHGTGQGVFFPSAGTRISEDTATLLSPAMIEAFVLPYIQKAADCFGGAFVHYCGQHEAFFEMLCKMPSVKAIDLGNPEKYDTRWLLECCCRTDTVLYSRLAAQDGETCRDYVRRIAEGVKKTGARCIFRPVLVPDQLHEAQQVYTQWHEIVNG